MARNFRTDIQSYGDADRVLKGTDAATIGHNTMLVRQGESIAAILYSTAIVVYHKNGSMTLNSGGYKTAATRHRLHGLVPLSIDLSWRDGWSVNGKPFVDGMIVK